jgi:hypothetical protein
VEDERGFLVVRLDGAREAHLHAVEVAFALFEFVYSPILGFVRAGIDYGANALQTLKGGQLFRQEFFE